MTSMLQRVPSDVQFGTFDDFKDLPPHPRQRDVERRLSRALKNQFAVASPTHAVVHIACYGGVLYKADGNTRNEAWKRGLLEIPGRLIFITYDISEYDDFLEIYSHFDSTFSVENNTDKLTGALASHDYELTSSLLKPVQWASAMQVASRGFGGETTDIYTNVDEFIEEIKALDARGYVTKVLPRGVTAAYFALRRKHGAAIDKFFDLFANNGGKKEGEFVDGVQYLRELCQVGTKASGQSLVLPQMEWTIAACEAWMADKQIRLFKVQQWKSDAGDDLIFPRLGKLDTVKIGGYLKGKRKLALSGGAV